jgi:hypothetical protein
MRQPLDLLFFGARRLRAYREAWLFSAVACVLVWMVYRTYTNATWLADDGEHAVKILAIAIGGLWVLYRFGLRRAFESALAMGIRVQATSSGSEYVVFLQVDLANIGGRRIIAAGRLSAQQREEYEDSVEYPCDLQVRSITPTEAVSPHLNWWKSPDNRDLCRVSVLEEYSNKDGWIDFFMEPQERYTLGQVLVLPRGHYMAKLVFVGSRAGAWEYWSQITYFRVPDLSVS